MNMPGFSGDSSLRRSRIYYQTAAPSGDVSASAITLALPIRNRPLGNGGVKCIPKCGPCTSTIDSSTGCIKSCVTLSCELQDLPCRGCANPCQGGLFCNGICTNPSVNPNNCGACGHVCQGGMICSNGVCVCAPGLANCNGICKDTSSDPSNCGTCGNSCGSDPCLGGQCPPPCPGRPQPFPWCGAPDSSVSCQCPPGMACGSREDPQQHIMSFDWFCQPCDVFGLTQCGTTCTDLMGDPSNCGACGSSCGPGMVCVNGSCAPCAAIGRTLCGTTCVNLSNDPLNCGTCGHACPSGQDCLGGGKCGFSVGGA